MNNRLQFCETCGNQYRTKPSRQHTAKYCSRKCYFISRTGKPLVLTEEERKRRSQSKMGPKNPQWKGDNVSYRELHSWVQRYKIKPKLCENCKKVPPYDLANVSGKYKRDINDYEYLCRKCHMTKDGRLERLRLSRKKEVEKA